MNWYGLGLFLHLCSVVAAFWFASRIFSGIERLWAAETAGQALDALAVAKLGARWMPWIALALFLTGAALVQSRWSWSLPWVGVSILGLIVIEGVGGASGKQHRKLAQQLAAQPRARDAKLDAGLAAAARSPLARTTHLMLPLLTVGVMLIMVTKPGALTGVIELIVAAAIGAVWGHSRTSAIQPSEVVRS